MSWQINIFYKIIEVKLLNINRRKIKQINEKIMKEPAK